VSVILNARGLNKAFGAVTAAKDVSAAIQQDSVVGLIGTNGAGKTTFINMITGYLKPDSGAIEYEFPEPVGRMESGGRSRRTTGRRRGRV